MRVRCTGFFGGGFNGRFGVSWEPMTRRARWVVLYTHSFDGQDDDDDLMISPNVAPWFVGVKRDCSGKEGGLMKSALFLINGE